jgi:hypothetical protein
VGSWSGNGIDLANLEVRELAVTQAEKTLVLSLRLRFRDLPLKIRPGPVILAQNYNLKNNKT